MKLFFFVNYCQKCNLFGDFYQQYSILVPSKCSNVFIRFSKLTGVTVFAQLSEKKTVSPNAKVYIFSQNLTQSFVER